jgi:CobQ-like glutamine amidotransferase family enzyme
MPQYIRGRPSQRVIADEEILRLYVEEELDSDTVGYRAGCCGSTVLEIVRKLGGVVRTRGNSKTLKLTDAEIIQRYKNGASGAILAKQASCDQGTIYRVLRRHGVRIRSSTETGRATKVSTRTRARLDKAKGKDRTEPG